jgi:hypothetical protein
MLRLKQQAKALHLSYEDVAKGAINARKEQEISSRVDLTKLTEDQRSLVASLAEIGPGGKVTLDIPGFGNITDLEATLKTNPNALAGALDKYQKDMNKSAADIQAEMISTAKSSLSVQEQMKNTLVAIQNQGIKSLEDRGKGTQMIEAMRQQTGAAGTDTETTIKNLKTTIDTQIDGISTEFTNFYRNLKTLTEAFVTASVAIAGTAATYLKTVVLNTGSAPYATPAPTVTAYYDVFIPSNGGNLISGSFGSLLSDGRDQMLLSPNISDFFKKYNEAENNLKSIGGPQTGGDLSLLYKQASAKPSESLTDLLTKTGSFPSGVSQINQKVEIGGKTEVVIDIRTNIPQNLVNEVLNTSQLKETIMTTVNNRLSAEFSDKLSNALITQKRG